MLQDTSVQYNVFLYILWPPTNSPIRFATVRRVNCDPRVIDFSSQQTRNI